MNWSSETLFRDVPDEPAGLQVRMAASARWPPVTPGCEVPLMSVMRSRRSSNGLRYFEGVQPRPASFG